MARNNELRGVAAGRGRTDGLERVPNDMTYVSSTAVLPYPTMRVGYIAVHRGGNRGQQGQPPGFLQARSYSH